MKIVFINGAPRSGKDSAGNMIAAEAPGKWISTKFATEVKERCHAAYRLTEAIGGRPFQHGHFEYVKDEPSILFHGRSPREAYKALSEKFMKPLHGKDIFGRMLVDRIHQFNRRDIDGFVITDSGFVEEAVPVVKEFGADNCMLLRLHRKGFTFRGDSRSLINLIPLGVKTYDVNSPDGDLPGLLENIKQKMPFLFRE